MLSSHKTSLFKVAYFLFFNRLIQARVKNCIISVKGCDIGNVFLPMIPSIFEPCYFPFPCIIPYHSLLGSTPLLSLGYSIKNRTCKFSSGIWFSLRPKKNERQKLTCKLFYFFADFIFQQRTGYILNIRLHQN